MDHELDSPGALKPDDLEEVASGVWPDREHTGRIGGRVEIDDGEGMADV